MQISLSKPPIWDEASKLFGVKESDPVWFTWDDCIFAPCKKMPPDYIIQHEEQHSEQQAGDPEVWWARYLRDAEFRAGQEAEAYGAQYRFFCTRTKDRERRFK